MFFSFKFIDLFLSVFLNFFEEIYDYTFKFCVLGFIWVILIGEHFYGTDDFWEDTIFIFHVLCILQYLGYWISNAWAVLGLRVECAYAESSEIAIGGWDVKWDVCLECLRTGLGVGEGS